MQQDLLAEEFEAHRGHLRAVGYRMLGSFAEAEDAVQDTWLRLSRTDADEIDNLGGWLTTVVSRICLDQLRARKARKEESTERALPGPGGHRGRRRPGARGGAPPTRSAWPSWWSSTSSVLRSGWPSSSTTCSGWPSPRSPRSSSAPPTRPRCWPAGPGGGSRTLAAHPTPTWRGNAPPSTRSSPRRGRVTSRPCCRSWIPTWCCAPRVSTPSRSCAAPPRSHRARSSFREVAPVTRSVLVDGVAGLAVLVDGQITSLAAFTVVDGKIVEIDIVNDPKRLRGITLPVDAG